MTGPKPPPNTWQGGDRSFHLSISYHTFDMKSSDFWRVVLPAFALGRRPYDQAYNANAQLCVP